MTSQKGFLFKMLSWDRSLLYSLVALLKQDSIASPSVDFTPFELTAADDIAAPISILYTLISVCDEIDSHFSPPRQSFFLLNVGQFVSNRSRSKERTPYFPLIIYLLGRGVCPLGLGNGK